MTAVVVTVGPQAGRRLELTADVVIGRQHADLVLEDPEVSRHHAVLRRSGGSILIEDLGSTNGTFVNRERIREPMTVRSGDEIRVGQTTLEIESDRRDETLVSLPLPPARASTVERRAVSAPIAPVLGGPVSGTDESTEPLPVRGTAGDVRSRLWWGWFGIGAVVLAAAVAVAAYVGLVDPATESRFVTSATEACDAVHGSGAGVDLESAPTRGELERARNIRLQALGAIRAVEVSREETAQIGRFLSAFGETNSSITRLASAIGGDQGKARDALRRLREDVNVERQVAANAGIDACGGLAIR